jgi:predicted enzyme related to lactoylglutathione lyase
MNHDDGDPLNVLHGADFPVTPDPEFAARLRARLKAALALPNRTEGVIMSGTDAVIAELAENDAEASSPRPAALPYLAVRGARAAIDWYADALGAALVGEPIVMDDGRVGHAELAFATGVLYLADEYPEIGLSAPAPGAVSVSLMLPVADTDRVLERARSRGAQVQRDPYENHGSRTAAIIDPFGHRWLLSGPVTGVRATIRHGDVGYVSLRTPDARRAAAFYGHVLGWTFDAEGRRVTNTTERIEFASAPGAPTLVCCYAVTDVAAARRSIIDGGGSVEEPFGSVLAAIDPAGLSFAVYEPAPGRPRPALNGTGPGELSYLTYEVPDSAAFKEFFGRILNWAFEPGRVDDGWSVVGAHPMSGAAGGSANAVTVPMWTVDDIDAAVARVREAGGTVIDEPSQQSYGMSALCTDDQGTRFYLGQH